MARKPFIAGNWKLNHAPGVAREVALGLAGQTLPGSVDVAICPTFLALPGVADALSGQDAVAVGAQNAYWEDSGAFTGEVSAAMLAGMVTYVIVGHSERRQYFGETDATVNKRVQAVLKHGLTPIICVGETLAENEAGQTAEVVQRQMKAAYAGLSAEDAARTVVAYEPVWAIGTGKNATGDYANAVCGTHIRAVVGELFGDGVAEGLRIQYGGSVKPDNAAEFAKQANIDGALVGGASLKVETFMGIINAWAAAVE